MSTTIADPILVTGATGFIGRHLVARLRAEGFGVRAFVLPGEVLPETWGDGVDDGLEVHRGDIADGAAVESAIDGAGTVYHLAAVVQDWGRSSWHERVTVGGTRHVLEAAAAHGTRAVLASSIVVYGDRIGREVCHEDVPFGRALGPYSRSKQAQERIARELAASTGFETTIVRPANVFGPGSVPWVHEVVSLLRRRQFALIDGGDRNAGLCHVDNLVEILLRAASLDVARGRPYNAVDGSDVTWRRYFTDLARLADTAPPRSLPMAAARPLAVVFETLWKVLPIFRQRPPITREALNLAGSHHRIAIDRARRELGYEPITTYDEALAPLLSTSLGSPRTSSESG